MKELINFKSKFDEEYFRYLRSKIEKTKLNHPRFAPVGEQLFKIARGGKRLRPFIFYLVYKSRKEEARDFEFENNFTDKNLLRVMFSLELFQLFALIHDDIIDKSCMRHGVKTLNSCFGTEQAILAGNQCLIWAVESIALMPNTKNSLEIFLQMAEETNTGQMIDASLTKINNIGDGEIFNLIDLKTSRYTFIYPSLLGLAYSENYETEVSEKGIDEARAYKKIGKYLGEAFQRLDDLMDIFGNEIELGKKIGTDVTLDNKTILYQNFLKIATSGQKEIYTIYKGQPLDKNDILRIREVFVASGVVDVERNEIKNLLNLAEETLSELCARDSYLEIWKSLINYFRNRLKIL